MKSQTTQIRNLLVGLGITTLILIGTILYLPSVVKSLGHALLIIPAQFGWVELVQPEEIQLTTLSDPPIDLQLRQAGRYAIYTDDFDLLSATVNLKRPWLQVTAVDEAVDVVVTLSGRGVRPYDVRQASGRPVIFFSVPDAGTYQLSHRAQGWHAEVSIVPDYISGREGRVWLLYLAQTVILFSPLWVWFIRSSITKRAYLHRQQQEKTRKRQELDRFMAGMKKEE
ncbi:MAG: hypothetical protein AAF629_04100 [Chloroflexota bacterium]